VDSKLLMRAALFTSTTKHAANNAYNCSNGDTFRWWDPDRVVVSFLVHMHHFPAGCLTGDLCLSLTCTTRTLAFELAEMLLLFKYLT
jgi:hypothetical protein